MCQSNQDIKECVMYVSSKSKDKDISQEVLYIMHEGACVLLIKDIFWLLKCNYPQCRADTCKDILFYIGDKAEN